MSLPLVEGADYTRATLELTSVLQGPRYLETMVIVDVRVYALPVAHADVKTPLINMPDEPFLNYEYLFERFGRTQIALEFLSH